MTRFQPNHRPRPRHLPGVMNKTEAAYAGELQLFLQAGLIAGYFFEALKLRLADKTFYTPDFLVIADHVELHEVKGFWQDDARVKIKVAAELYPHFIFKAVTLKNKVWHVEEF